jgi:hypothetical protein
MKHLDVKFNIIQKEHSFTPNIILSVGPIEELEVTPDELAQMVCAQCNAHLQFDITKNWFAHALLSQTNLLDGYIFFKTLVKLTGDPNIDYGTEELVICARR